MPVVNWVPQPVKKNLSFDSVAVNQNFKIVSTASQGAVYRKVVLSDAYGQVKHYMMEEQTGRLFPPTNSYIELVEVSVSIQQSKPACY